LDFDGFDWDDGNWPKCGKHGLEQSDIEAAFYADAYRLLEAPPRGSEERFVLIAFSQAHWVSVVFTKRERFVRPISARYLHAREVLRYVT
jgi:uncharacterized DUF497 family protein